MDLKLRCSASGCECINFVAATTKDSLRVCDGCSHSWITHLLEKLLTSRDDALSIFDVCSLALYGTHALPIRLKIVIERLLSTLQPDEVEKILRSFGWNSQDLGRGYMIQDPRGGPLAKWTMPPREEEVLILQQFLRFPSTRALSFALLRDDFPLMSPGNVGVGGLSLPPTSNYSSLFNPFVNFSSGNVNLHHPHPPPPLGPSSNTNNPSNSTPNNSSTSNLLLSPNKSPVHHNNNIPTSLLSHLGALGGMGLPHFSPASLVANFSVNPTINNNHQQQSQNNGKSHGTAAAAAAASGASRDNRSSRCRNSRRSTNSSALNLSVQSDSDENDELLMKSKGGDERNHDQVVDLSSNGGGVGMGSSKGGGGGGGAGGGSSKRKSHGNSSGASSTNSSEYNHTHNPERDRLLSSLNSLLPSSGMIKHELSPGDSQSQSKMSNELLNNLNNMHKSVDLMAAAAAAAAAVSSGRENLPSSTPSRKSGMSAVKRDRGTGWAHPVPSMSQMMNSSAGLTAQGKRRVQCSVCMKTFCDKGALKIHFSAVHLREMHKCTVAGCNMMFSSRRSRNRHSANPNPKLHSPHLRRKISPHDGRSSQPLINLSNPMLFPGSPAGIRFPPFLPMGGGGGGGGGGGSSRSHPHNGILSSSSIKEEKSESEEDEGHHMSGSSMMMEVDPDVSNSEASFSSEEANECSGPKSSPTNSGESKKDGARKRKLTNPVRFANNNAPPAVDDSNDEFCCYDDGTLVSHEDEDIEENDEEGKGGDNNNPSQQNGHPHPLHVPPTSPSSSADGARRRRRQLSNGGEDEANASNHNHQEGDGGVVERTKYNREEGEGETNHLGKLESLPIFSESPRNSEDSLKSDEERGDEEGGSPNSIGDIPMDPENPRRCLVCGKQFQNLFGVKTHYQNVHLKLMHKCIVEGCKATFPSKRSRDRHASNLNLHRKLFSTSDDNVSTNSNDSYTKEEMNGSVKPQSGGDQVLVLTGSNKPTPPYLNPFFFGSNGLPVQQNFSLPNKQHPQIPIVPSSTGLPTPWNPFLPFQMFPSLFNLSGVGKDYFPSISDCGFCGKSFIDGATFTSHLESCHSNDVFRCKCCSSVFDTRTKLESHSKRCTV